MVGITFFCPNLASLTDGDASYRAVMLVGERIDWPGTHLAREVCAPVLVPAGRRRGGSSESEVGEARASSEWGGAAAGAK